MKILQIVIFLTLATNSFAKDGVKALGEIKTFDFERVLAQTEHYYETSRKWKKIKCTAKTGFVCTKRECPQLKTVQDAHMILDRKEETISLCKNKLCRYYRANFRQNGVFTNIRLEDSDGITIKVLGDSRYKEISLIGLDAYVTNGECVPIK